MKKAGIIIFGYNDYTKEIVKQIGDDEARIYTLDESLLREAKEAGHDAALFDLSDRWDEIASQYDIARLRVFCMLEDDAENIFLTISLRASFETVFIVALALNQESARKLRIAGANKIMPVLQTTANIITEHLEKPIVLKAVHDLLYGESDVMIAEVTLRERSAYLGRELLDVDQQKTQNVIILSVTDKRLKTSFAVTKRGYHHTLSAGDIITVIGYNDEIKAFETFVGGSQ